MKPAKSQWVESLVAAYCSPLATKPRLNKGLATVIVLADVRRAHADRDNARGSTRRG